MFGATTGRAPTRCSQSTERSGAHHGHGWCTANFPLPWHPSRGRSRAPGRPSASSRLVLPACQPVPSACLCPVLTSSSVHSWCRHISPTRGWLAGTYPLLPSTVTSNPPSDIFDAFPSISDSLHAPRCTHPHRNPQTTVAAARSKPPPPAPLSCQYRHSWPGRGIGSSIWERGARESTASTRLRRRP